MYAVIMLQTPRMETASNRDEDAENRHKHAHRCIIYLGIF